MEDTKKLIEKYKRELMELSKTAPQPVREERPAEEKPPKTPKIIGYVTEESGEFPAVFDKFITEAVENNEVETVRNEAFDDMDDMAESVGISRERSDDLDVNDVVEVPEDLFNDVNSGDLDNSGNADAQNEMAQGTGESISNFPVPEYDTLAEFETNNRGGGTLAFRVFTAREALPIENAAIVVTTRINGRNHEMFNAQTDNSGETRVQTLPAPSKELSQHADNNIQPFSLYDASVEKIGYAKVILRDIPIFDGVQSIQRVAMIPEAELDRSNGPSEEITEVSDAK